jgi:hypothetical protein
LQREDTPGSEPPQLEIAMTLRRLLLRALVAMPCAARLRAASAASFDAAHFSIDLPDGYIGPAEHIAGAAVSRGFRKPYPGTALNTVILITVQEMGATFGRQVGSERMRLTRETLDPIVAGIEDNRAGFRKSAPRDVVLAGYPGLQVRWSGAAQGVAFEGIVYCVLVGSRAYAIQLQDPAGRGKERLAEAMRAVERMRIPK